MKLRAPAKLNVRLRVFGRGEDGYHSIETLFLRLGLADEVTIVQNQEGLHFDTSGIGDIPSGSGNLCWQAADAFYRAIERPPAASIGLVKHIPIAAGLGGGSSDAASVLLGLNQVHDHALDQSDLMGLAGELGSDIPFFLSEARFAVGRDRGGRLLPLAPPPSRAVLIVVPDFGVSAGEAYDWLSIDRAVTNESAACSSSELPPSDQLSNWDVLGRLAQNDLADPVFRRHPALQAATESLTRNGAEIALLCGSGACVAGIFPTKVLRNSAARNLQDDPAISSRWHLISTWSDGLGSSEAGG